MGGSESSLPHRVNIVLGGRYALAKPKRGDSPVDVVPAHVLLTSKRHRNSGGYRWRIQMLGDSRDCQGRPTKCIVRNDRHPQRSLRAGATVCADDAQWTDEHYWSLEYVDTDSRQTTAVGSPFRLRSFSNACGMKYLTVDESSYELVMQTVRPSMLWEFYDSAGNTRKLSASFSGVYTQEYDWSLSPMSSCVSSPSTAFHIEAESSSSDALASSPSRVERSAAVPPMPTSEASSPMDLEGSTPKTRPFETHHGGPESASTMEAADSLAGELATLSESDGNSTSALHTAEPRSSSDAAMRAQEACILQLYHGTLDEACSAHPRSRDGSREFAPPSHFWRIGQSLGEEVVIAPPSIALVSVFTKLFGGSSPLRQRVADAPDAVVTTVQPLQDAMWCGTGTARLTTSVPVLGRRRYEEEVRLVLCHEGGLDKLAVQCVAKLAIGWPVGDFLTETLHVFSQKDDGPVSLASFGIAQPGAHQQKAIDGMREKRKVYVETAQAICLSELDFTERP